MTIVEITGGAPAEGIRFSDGGVYSHSSSGSENLIFRFSIKKSTEVAIESCPHGLRQAYDIDISSMNLRHHWNESSRTSAADVSDLPSVIHSSEACAV
jgi:hypothetical protein